MNNNDCNDSIEGYDEEERFCIEVEVLELPKQNQTRKENNVVTFIHVCKVSEQNKVGGSQTAAFQISVLNNEKCNNNNNDENERISTSASSWHMWTLMPPMMRALMGGNVEKHMQTYDTQDAEGAQQQKINYLATTYVKSRRGF